MTKKSIYAYIFNSSTLFNNVPMAQRSTHMPCNREAAGSNPTEAFGFSLKGPLYVVDDSGKKTYLAGLQCTLTSSCAKKPHVNLIFILTLEKRNVSHVRTPKLLPFLFFKSPSEYVNRGILGKGVQLTRGI